MNNNKSKFYPKGCVIESLSNGIPFLGSPNNFARLWSKAQVQAKIALGFVLLLVEFTLFKNNIPVVIILILDGPLHIFFAQDDNLRNKISGFSCSFRFFHL